MKELPEGKKYLEACISISILKKGSAYFKMKNYPNRPTATFSIIVMAPSMARLTVRSRLIVKLTKTTLK